MLLRAAYFFLLYTITAVPALHGQPTLPSQPKKKITVYKDTAIFEKIIHKSTPPSIIVGGAIALHTVNDKLLPLPLSQDCEKFLSGKGLKPFLQLGLDFALSNGLFHIRPTLFYEALGADHTWAEYAQATDTTGGVRKDKTIEFDHIITNNTKAIGISALFNWSPLPHLSFGVAPSLAYLFDQTYTKIVTVVTPGEIILDKGVPVRKKTELSGSLPNARSLMPAISMRVAADLPLSSRLRAEPTLSFNLPISGVTSYWSQYSIRAGIDLRYELPSSEDTEIITHHQQRPIEIAVTEPLQPKFQAHVDVVASDLNGTDQHVARLEVRQITARTAYPMLNYIFFDSASMTIAARYKQYSSYEDASRLFKGSIERRGERIADLYLETLNILGERLHRFPTATIRLIGSVANVSGEEGRSDIALGRAQTIKNYLHTVWNIDLHRMSVGAVLTPNKPSPNTISKGREENRRVEIITNDNRITDPLYVTNIEHTANPPHITIMQSYSDGVMERYHVSIKIAGKEVSGFDGDSTNAPLNNYWTVTEEALSPQTDSLQIELTATSTKGEQAFARSAIKLEQFRVNQEEEQRVDRFSLILFGFDESSLGDRNERTIGFVTDILKKIKPKQLNVIGYTDELGDEAHNNELSSKRANEAAFQLSKEIQKRGIILPGGIVVGGKGSHERLYDNRLPEGRFLSRTVLITIER